MSIFQNPYQSTETWSAQGALIKWSGGKVGTGNPLLVLQISIQYQRRIQPFYPIASDAQSRKKINMVGAPVGQMTIGSIFTPSATGLSAFLKAVGAPCKDAENAVTMTLQPFGDVCKNGTSSQANGETFTLTGVELESVGVQIQGGEVAVVNMPTTYSFTDMDLA